MEHLARQAERRHLSLICSISTFTTGPQELREEHASEQEMQTHHGNCYSMDKCKIRILYAARL